MNLLQSSFASVLGVCVRRCSTTVWSNTPINDSWAPLHPRLHKKPFTKVLQLLFDAAAKPTTTRCCLLPSITMGSEPLVSNIVLVNLKDRSGTREPVTYVLDEADSAADPQTVGCNKLCELLGVKQHIGQRTQVFAASEGPIAVPHSNLSSLSKLHSIVAKAPQIFTFQGITLTLWYTLPADVQLPIQDPPAPKSDKQHKKYKQQSSTADKGPHKKRKQESSAEDSSAAHEAPHKKMKIKLESQDDSPSVTPSSSTTKVPSSVTKPLYNRADVVMPRSKNGGFLIVEGKVMDWRDWVVRQHIEWCKDNNVNLMGISSKSLSTAVTG